MRQPAASRTPAAAPRVLILTTFDLDEYAFAGLRAGASGFLVKDAQPTELLAGIRAVAAGDAVVAPALTRRLIEKYAHLLPARADADPAATDPRLSALTDREREVLQAIARGWTNSEIADRLHLAESTVKTHVGRILAKIDARDRVQAVIFAYDTAPGPPRLSASGAPPLPRLMPLRARRRSRLARRPGESSSSAFLSHHRRRDCRSCLWPRR